MRNLTFQSNIPAIIYQVGETKPAESWEASEMLTEREIVVDFFKKAIAILDNVMIQTKNKYPSMFRK